ncbi:MAG TPA: PD-(D/E)XK nuclease family protein [Steroidobacteraceae bacterium]
MPTRRLAHFLRARHDAACAAQGLRVWRTPELVTWPDLLHRQFEADRAAGRTSARWLATTHARLVWEQIVRRDQAQQRVLSPAGLGAVAYRSWTLLHQYRIPYAALGQGDGPEVQAFAAWVEEYRRWLQQGDWLDPALAATVVGPFSAATPLSFVGFDRWTPEQAALLEKLQQGGVPCTITPVLDEAAPLRAAAVECNDFDAELETAARWVAACLQRQPGARLALIVPALDRERGRVRRALDRVLVPGAAVTGGPAPESTAYELAAARPLVERPVVAAALAWLDACARPADLVQVSALLLGPYDGAAATEWPLRAEMDVELRRSGLQVPGLERIALEARRSQCGATAERLEAAARRSRTWGSARLPSQWAAEFMALLVDVGWPGAKPDSAEHQAAQRWQALVGEFGASDDITGPMRAPTALGHLRDLAATTAFEPQEIAAPLLVIDPDTAIGMHFDAVWVCGLDAARWPAPASPDPFLPREWQARQGVPGATAELAEQAAWRTLRGLAQAAATVVCSVPRFEDEAPLLPSALVADLPRDAALDLWSGAGTTDALFAARPQLEVLTDGSLPAFAASEVVKGGARLLELQAACPFRAAVELRLGGRLLEDPVIGIAATERGRLAHSVLEGFWREVRDQSTLLAMSTAQRAQRVREITTRVLAPLRQVANDVQSSLLDLEQGWLEARTLEMLEQDAAREPFSVAHVEDPRLLDVGGVQVHVVLDRVDRLADGSYAFIDYKTGSSAKTAAWMGERPQLPQLPLYLRTVGPDEVGALAFGVVRKGATGYKGFARSDGLFATLQPFDAARAPFKEYADWPALLREWQRRLDALAREHAQGDARLAPNPTQACRYCHLPGLCRSAQALAATAEAADEGG